MGRNFETLTVPNLKFPNYDTACERSLYHRVVWHNDTPFPFFCCTTGLCYHGTLLSIADGCWKIVLFILIFVFISFLNINFQNSPFLQRWATTQEKGTYIMANLRPKKKNCYVALTRPKFENWVGRSGFFFFFFFFFFLRTVRELSFPIFFFLNGENSGGMQSKRIYIQVMQVLF